MTQADVDELRNAVESGDPRGLARLHQKYQSIIKQAMAQREALDIEIQELIAQIERVYGPCGQAKTYPH